MSEQSAEPTDDEIESRLREAPIDRWNALWFALDELEHEPTDHFDWRGGEQVDTTVVDGVERPVFQVPYVVYSDAVERTIRRAAEVGAIVPFDWPHWDGADKYQGGDSLAEAPVADAVRMVTAIVRADRFSEGTVAAMLENGTLLAALHRIRRWYEEDSRSR